MKASNGIIARLTALIKQHPLRFIITLSGVILLTELACFGMAYNPDTPGYFVAWNNFLRDGVDICRTPSYPMFINVISAITGNFGDYAIGLVQTLICLVSIRYFWYLCFRLTSSKRITFVTTALYALIPGITENALIMMTESLAMSGVIFLITLLVKIYDNYKVKYAVCIVLLTLFLVFLRPALLYLVVVLGVVGILFLVNRKKKQSIVLFLSVMLSVSSLYGYCKAFERKTDIFMLTKISIVNDEWLIKTERLDERLKFEDSVMNDFLSYYNLTGVDTGDWTWIVKLEKKYPIQVHKKFVDEAKKRVGWTWYNRMILRVFSSSSTPIFCCDIPELGFGLIFTYLPLRMSFFYYVMLLYAVVLVCEFCKNRKINWLNWALCLSCFGNVAVMLIGTFSEWARMMLPVVSLLFLMIAQIVACSKIKFNKCQFHIGECSKNNMK